MMFRLVPLYYFIVKVMSEISLFTMLRYQNAFQNRHCEGEIHLRMHIPKAEMLKYMYLMRV